MPSVIQPGVLGLPGRLPPYCWTTWTNSWMMAPTASFQPSGLASPFLISPLTQASAASPWTGPGTVLNLKSGLPWALWSTSTFTSARAVSPANRTRAAPTMTARFVIISTPASVRLYCAGHGWQGETPSSRNSISWEKVTARQSLALPSLTHDKKPHLLSRLRLRTMKATMTIGVALLLWILASGWAPAGEVALPPRPMDAPKGAALAGRIAALDLATREKEIIAEVSRGNVPEFWRHFVPVTVTRKVDQQDMTAVYEVSPDYLAIGADDDYFLVPVSPA